MYFFTIRFGELVTLFFLAGNYIFGVLKSWIPIKSCLLYILSVCISSWSQCRKLKCSRVAWVWAQYSLKSQIKVGKLRHFQFEKSPLEVKWDEIFFLLGRVFMPCFDCRPSQCLSTPLCNIICTIQRLLFCLEDRIPRLALAFVVKSKNCALRFQF